MILHKIAVLHLMLFLRYSFSLCLRYFYFLSWWKVVPQLVFALNCLLDHYHQHQTSFLDSNLLHHFLYFYFTSFVNIKKTIIVPSPAPFWEMQCSFDGQHEKRTHHCCSLYAALNRFFEVILVVLHFVILIYYHRCYLTLLISLLLLAHRLRYLLVLYWFFLD